MLTKLRLTNRYSIAVFAFCITLLAIGVTTALEYLLYPAEFATTAPDKKAIIVSANALPIGWIVGEMLRKNQLLADELSDLVNRDRLTDVATRDFFFARMQRDPHAYGISLMVDIDAFKTVNDTFGHMAGDAVISRVAAILHENTRAQDIVCRFGGEEFVIFLHEQGAVDGFKAAERMRQAIAEEVVDFDGDDLRVTVSIGGSLKERLMDVNLAIKEADAALYRAKQSGRNRTVFAPKIAADTDPAAA